MLRLDLEGVAPTKRLLDDQNALNAATDTAGPAVVKERGNAGYGSKAMRNRLAGAQDEKCGYCEERLRERAGEVDHIRPKDPSKYWWLAFSVRNLIAACRSCNNAKSSKFELQPGTTKLVARQKPWEVDEPSMLVDPTIEDPTPHITYRFELGEWRIAGITERGTWTVKELELDRDSFRIETNRYIADAMLPRALAYREAVAAGDRDAILGEITALRTLASADKPWTQLLRTVVDAVARGEWPPDR